MSALAIFASTFVVVFALGLQQLNVAGRYYLAAFITSLAISAAQLAILKLVPVADAPLDYLAFMSGGPIGIVCAMLAHPWIVASRFSQPPHQDRKEPR